MGNKSPCDITAEILTGISNGVISTLSLGDTAIVNTVVTDDISACRRRRLQTNTGQAKLQTSIIIPADQATAVESTVTASQVSDSKENMNAMLATVTLSDGTPLSNPITVTSDPVRSVRYYNPPSQKKDEVSTSAVVGIVIGVLFGVILIVVVVIILKKRATKTTEVYPA